MGLREKCNSGGAEKWLKREFLCWVVGKAAGVTGGVYRSLFTVYQVAEGGFERSKYGASLYHPFSIRLPSVYLSGVSCTEKTLHVSGTPKGICFWEVLFLVGR